MLLFILLLLPLTIWDVSSLPFFASSFGTKGSFSTLSLSLTSVLFYKYSHFNYLFPYLHFQCAVFEHWSFWVLIELLPIDKLWKLKLCWCLFFFSLQLLFPDVDAGEWIKSEVETIDHRYEESWVVISLCYKVVIFII